MWINIGHLKSRIISFFPIYNFLVASLVIIEGLKLQLTRLSNPAANKFSLYSFARRINIATLLTIVYTNRTKIVYFYNEKPAYKAHSSFMLLTKIPLAGG